MKLIKMLCIGAMAIASLTTTNSVSASATKCAHYPSAFAYYGLESKAMAWCLDVRGTGLNVKTMKGSFYYNVTHTNPAMKVPVPKLPMSARLVPIPNVSMISGTKLQFRFVKDGASSYTYQTYDIPSSRPHTLLQVHRQSGWNSLNLKHNSELCFRVKPSSKHGWKGWTCARIKR